MYGIADNDGAPRPDEGYSTGPSTGIIQNYLAAEHGGEALNENTNGVGGEILDKMNAQRAQWKTYTGEDVPVYSTDPRVLQDNPQPNSHEIAPQGGVMDDVLRGSNQNVFDADGIQKEKEFQQKVSNFNSANPNRQIPDYSSIYNDATQKIGTQREAMGDVENRATWGGDFGAFAGGMVAQLHDPAMLAATVGTAALTDGSSLLMRLGTEAAVNGGINHWYQTQVQNPLLQKYNQPTPSNYEQLKGDLEAGALGAGMRGAGELGAMVLPKAKMVVANLKDAAKTSDLAADLLKAKSPDEAGAVLRQAPLEEVYNLNDKVNPDPNAVEIGQQNLAAHEILHEETQPEDTTWAEHEAHLTAAGDAIDNYNDDAIPMTAADIKAHEEWAKHIEENPPETQPVLPEQPLVREAMKESDTDYLLEHELGAKPENIIPLGQTSLDEAGRMTNEKMTVDKMRTDIGEHQNLIDAMTTCMRAP